MTTWSDGWSAYILTIVGLVAVFWLQDRIVQVTRLLTDIRDDVRRTEQIVREEAHSRRTGRGTN